jgi:hypothetical protein
MTFGFSKIELSKFKIPFSILDYGSHPTFGFSKIEPSKFKIGGNKQVHNGWHAFSLISSSGSPLRAYARTYSYRPVTTHTQQVNQNSICSNQKRSNIQIHNNLAG